MSKILSRRGQNELVSVWVANVWRSDFVYDARMRLRQRLEYAGSGSPILTRVQDPYDGNVVVQELDGNDTPQVSYTRSRDLSGTMQGAGGIGRLLARTDNTAGTHAYFTLAASITGGAAKKEVLIS